MGKFDSKTRVGTGIATGIGQTIEILNEDLTWNKLKESYTSIRVFALAQLDGNANTFITPNIEVPCDLFEVKPPSNGAEPGSFNFRFFDGTGSGTLVLQLNVLDFDSNEGLVGLGGSTPWSDVKFIVEGIQ